MKKFTIATLLAIATFAASATELNVTGIRDTTQNNVTGYKLTIAQPVTQALTLNAGFENTAGVAGTNVDTYTVGAAYDVAKSGAITLTTLASVGNVNVQNGVSGNFGKYGVQVGVAVMPGLTTSLTLARQLGTSTVNTLDRTEAVVGVRYAFTKAMALTSSATFYDNTPGSKMALGVSYAF